MPALTRIPQVLDALVALLRALYPESTGVQVLDGPVLGEVMQEVICVGLTEGPDRPGYTVTLARQQGLGAPRYIEEWSVRTVLSLSTGDTDMPALRSRVGSMLEEIDGALRGAHSNPSVWDRAALGGDMEWIPVQHTGGATMNVFFEVVGASLL